MKKNIKYIYVMVVWGENYTELFTDVSIPFLISPGNLRGIEFPEDSLFLIFTSKNDRSTIEKNKNYLDLSNVIECEFIECSFFSEDIPYFLKASRAHKLAAKIASENGAYCIFLAPDFIISKGSLAYLERLLISKPYSIVYVPGIRVNTEDVINNLSNLISIKEKIFEAVGSRDLVRFCLEYIHDENLDYFFNSDYYSQSPVVTIFNNNETPDILVRALHLHPIAMKFPKNIDLTCLDYDTIDGRLAESIIIDWDDVFTIKDSDDFVLFSLTNKSDRIWKKNYNLDKLETLSRTAFGPSCNSLHRFLLTKYFFIHSNDLDENMKNLIKFSYLVTNRALNRINNIVDSNALELPTILKRNYHLRDVKKLKFSFTGEYFLRCVSFIKACLRARKLRKLIKATRKIETMKF